MVESRVPFCAVNLPSSPKKRITEGHLEGHWDLVNRLMEKKLEATIFQLRFRVQGLGFRVLGGSLGLSK